MLAVTGYQIRFNCHHADAIDTCTQFVPCLAQVDSTYFTLAAQALLTISPCITHTADCMSKHDNE